MTNRETNAARWWRAALPALAAAMLLLGLGWRLRAPLHSLPLERDEGAYATIAARWLAGDALYRDLFDHKPPLVYLVFALGRALPGDPVYQIRALATIYLLASGLATLALGWRLYGRWAGLAALALFLAYGSSLRFQGLTFNSEAVLALPATLGCLLAVAGMRARSRIWFGLAGACVGLAIAAKPIGVALLGPLALAPLLAPSRTQLEQVSLAKPPSSQRFWNARFFEALRLCTSKSRQHERQSLASCVAVLSSRRPSANRGALLASALLGALLPLAGFTLVLWLEGALPAAFEALVVYNRLYAAESLAQGWDPSYLWRIWAPMFALGLPALAGLLASLARRDWRSPAHLVAALWGLALLATALLSLRAYPHYYLAAVPIFGVWAGAGLSIIAGTASRHKSTYLYHESTKDRRNTNEAYYPFVPSWLRSEISRLMRPLAALVALGGLLNPPIAEIWPLRGQGPYEQIGSLYGPEGYAYFGHADKVADYVRQHVPNGAPIFVWAAEPEIYYLAGYPPASRFVYDYPIERLPGGRDQLLRALNRAPPALIVTYHDVRPMGFHPFMPEHGYTLRATIGGFDVYEREDSAS